MLVLRLIAPYATVFVSSFCIMVVELVAGRVIAKDLGSSIYTWTSVIGVVLAGIAGGNYLGGWIADRHRPVRSFATIFLLASVVASLTPALNRVVADWVLLWTLDWPLRVALHVAAVFLVPSFLLGTISPIAAKMSLAATVHTGRTLGSIYAWGVVGSIVGTFLTGFYFIPTFGTVPVLAAVAVLLGIVALGIATRSALAWSWFALIAIVATMYVARWSWADVVVQGLGLREEASPSLLCEIESQYSEIRVMTSEKDGVLRHHLMIDKMIHNTLRIDEPMQLLDAYARMFATLTRVVHPSPDPLRTLTLGGGAYVVPRYLQGSWPGSVTDVVEIDPEVTRVAQEYLKLSDPAIRTWQEDGRAFVNRLVRERQGGESLEPYDVIFLDAFNDYSVPYQLTTLEQDRMIRELLAPSGAFMINMIDSFDIGLLLGSIVKTLRQAFPNVSVFYEGTAATLRSRATFVVFASMKTFDFEDVTTAAPDVSGIHALTDAELAAVTSRRERMILTDDWAPTENFLAPVVESSSARLASGALVSRGIHDLNGGRLASAEQKFTRALEIDPREHQAHRYLGAIRAQLGDYDGARARYEASLRFDPTQIELYEDMALEASNRGRLDEAEAFLRRGLHVEPSNEDLQVNLGILLAQQGDLPGAVSQFERVVRTAPGSFTAQVSLGRALAQLGDPERALEHLELAARIRPDDDDLRELLARTRKSRPQSPNR